MPLSFGRRVSILPRDRQRQSTYPLANSSRKKDRRWPLVLRFTKGSIHSAILFPVFIHSILTALIVWINQHISRDFNLPSTIIPSLSIVVGLMLVFRNQTAFQRFWDGRCQFSVVTTSIRCLSRQILVLVPAPPMQSSTSLHTVMSNDSMIPKSMRNSRDTLSDRAVTSGEVVLSRSDEIRTIETVNILIAMLYTIKNHLRAEWGVALSPGTSLTENGQESTGDEYKDLLPAGLKGYEHRGLGLTLELATFVEKFINMGVSKNWFHNAASAAMLGELNALIKAYGAMEVIRLVPIPVAHLIHHKQTLALYCGILPFAMASEMDWWAVPLVAFVSFTLYGIEGIAQTYEDPFGVAKIDINMDDIVEDTRREVEVLLTAWQTQGPGDGGIFRPRVSAVPKSDNSSEFYDGELNTSEESGVRSGVRFVVSDMTEGSGSYRDDDQVEIRNLRTSRLSSAVSPGTVSAGSGGSDYFDANNA
ncbi:uncharacterized protein LY89DRAFT_637881 [Mollisia scopiformis]|uniref:Uncharacterized protein n=1 Tax=Mollisia scopiformis TaxID=149040 RepID=A0A194XNQ5_MOLSC|nr:uncharacterized protein LY89DRAFT_637881 [Mollisia scopiformis]KUJ21865.1 hypothetical protein LY89DRAFT_637881 [Mollisia scopiformis]